MSGLHFVDARELLGPTFGSDVVVCPYSLLGLMPLTTAANRRPLPDTIGRGHLGSRTIIGARATIYAGVKIGEDCRLGDNVVIREECFIGNRCVIGTNVDIQYGVSIADDVRVMNGSHITGGTKIDSGSFIGPGVMTANDRRVDLKQYEYRGHVGPSIGKRVMVGVGAIILPGIIIGDDAVIGAGAVVTKNVAPGARIIAPGVAGGAGATDRFHLASESR